MVDENTNGKFKVLVLEDEPSLRKVYQRAFRTIGDVEIAYAANVNEAKTLLREGYSPDGVITDDKMPGMRGSDFIPELRASGFSGKIVLASGDLFDLVNDPLVAKVYLYSVGCFYKPFRPGCLPDGLLNYLRTGIMPKQEY